MLEKRDRGRGADVAAAPLSYGASRAASRVEGADLLQVGNAFHALNVMSLWSVLAGQSFGMQGSSAS